MEEKLLISELQKGTSAAFGKLIDEYQKRVFNTCLGYVYNSEDAEDLSQEVFLEIFRSIHNFKGESKLSTWIYRISVTKSLEMLRKRKRKKRAGKVLSLFGLQEIGYEPKASSYDHPGVQLENKERAAILFRAIESLPENQRIAFTMHNMDGKSYLEIADLMGLSLGSVESLIFRARKNLKKKLEHYYRNKDWERKFSGNIASEEIQGHHTMKNDSEIKNEVEATLKITEAIQNVSPDPALKEKILAGMEINGPAADFGLRRFGLQVAAVALLLIINTFTILSFSTDKNETSQMAIQESPVESFAKEYRLNNPYIQQQVELF